MKARDVMTRVVRTAKADTPVAKLAQTMLTRRISALPIVDRQRHVIGMVSEGDLLRRVESGTEGRPSWWSRLLTEPPARARAYVKSHGRFARDVMTREIVSVAEDTDIVDVVDTMEKWGIKRVPVVRDGKLVGLVSRSDLLRAVGRSKPRQANGRRRDVDLRDTMRRKLDATPWIGASFVNFVVRKGQIELLGAVPSTAQRDAIRVMAETIGARSVKDSLSIIPHSFG